MLGGWRGASVSPAALKKKPIVRDPFQEAQDTSDWIVSVASDPLPEIEEPSASIASDPLPEIEEPSASIASDPLPEIEEPSASIAPDPIPEDEGGEIDFDNIGMTENDIKELLGDSYDSDVDEKF